MKIHQKVMILYVCLIFFLLTVSASSGQSDSERATVVLSGLNVPYAIALDNDGNIYFTEYGSGTLKVLMKGTEEPLTLISNLTYPYAVAVNENGDIYFTEKTGTLSVLRNGQSHIETLASDFGRVYGLAVDSDGHIYMAGFGSTMGKESGTIMRLNSNVTDLLSGVTHPVGIVVDREGKVFFDEYDDGTAGMSTGTLKVLFKDGKVQTLAINLTSPTGLAVDNGGNIYFAESSVGRIRMLPSAGGTFRIVAENLTSPWSLALDEKEKSLYVSSKTVNGTITKIDLSGLIQPTPTVTPTPNPTINSYLIPILAGAVGAAVGAVIVFSLNRRKKEKSAEVTGKLKHKKRRRR